MPKTYKEIVAELEKDLDADLVATRPTPWGEVAYLETPTAIRQANRIFGFGGWERIITQLPTKVGDGYQAAVRVTVHMPDDKGHIRHITHEDVGYRRLTREGGEEAAIKGAVSDALKRCLRAFGPQFGLDIGLHEDEDEPKPISPPKPEERKVQATIVSVTKTVGETKWPYEVEFLPERGSTSEILPAYLQDLDTLLKPRAVAVLTITRSRAGNAYIKSVEKVEGA